MTFQAAINPWFWMLHVRSQHLAAANCRGARITDTGLSCGMNKGKASDGKIGKTVVG